jgi:hypothetical protein
VVVGSCGWMRLLQEKLFTAKIAKGPQDRQAKRRMLLARGALLAQAYVLDHFVRLRGSLRNRLDALRIAIVVEFLASWPPQGISAGTLHAGVGLEGADRSDGNYSVQDSKQNQSMHGNLAENVSARRAKSCRVLELRYRVGDPGGIRRIPYDERRMPVGEVSGLS